MPKISVILPVYNGEKYLSEAIDSILAQTFTDFELLVMNDGSTDGSGDIIDSYADQRLYHIRNEKNEGLIHTLNKGISLATGEYIARMDADDVALPERLARQLSYLEQYTPAVLATRVKLMAADGKSLPDWKDDAENVSAVQIRHFLQKDNCLAHPSVMAKTALFKKYRYRFNQKYSEDYDLWLRVLADGLRIEKLDEPLLLHRILPTSATRFKKVNLFYRLAKVKFRFLWPQIKKGRLTAFNAGVFANALLDLAKAGSKEIKGIFKK